MMLRLIAIALLMFTACAKAEFSTKAKENGKRSPGSGPRDGDRLDTNNNPKPGNENLNTPGEPSPEIQKIFDKKNGDQSPGDPLPNTITFAEDRSVYHIGDDKFAGSSCRASLREKETKGQILRFPFVVKAQTQANILVENICGVDRPTNILSLVKSGGVLASKTLDVLKGKLVLNGLDLAPGSYEITIESTEYDLSPDNKDRDDILIEDIQISSQAQIEKGDVTFE